ncbi:VCBS repeat-containing protein [Chitinophaga sp. MM2321]|uniref:FG-GAP repeat domain-containing protein n=1 Tax=Chitinophaga sp. MM2321 TaxID=3137178 RepID=UPI0032D5B058
MQVGRSTSSYCKLLLGGFCFLAMTFLSNRVLAQTWTQDSYAGFSAGSTDAAGQNLYITKQGDIRNIHRFDLNTDGYIDLLFNSTHNYDYYVPATLMSMSKDRNIQVGDLAVDGSISVEIADLNRDGYPDMVFCPNSNGLQSDRRFLTIIWGAADGWSSARSNGLLPVNGAKSVVVADLNQDSWPDIVTLNSASWMPNQPEGNVIRIYWGSPKGYMLTRYKDVGVDKGTSLAAGDFDANGFADVAVLADDVLKVLWSAKAGEEELKTTAMQDQLNSSGIKLPEADNLCLTAADTDGDGVSDLIIGTAKKIHIIGSGKNKTWKNIKTVAMPVNASSITAGDLDHDGSPDLVISSSLLNPQGGAGMGESKTVKSNSIVMWGNKGEFSASGTTELDAPYAVSTAIADLDNDGQLDIICAVEHGETTYAATSPIFLGKGNRTFEQDKSGIQTKGAYKIGIIPANNKLENKSVHAVICNRMVGNLYENVPLYLYWGGANGFSTDRRTDIPFTSGYHSLAADFNMDGYPDLVSMNSMHGGGEMDPSAGANIFWGGKDGYDFKNKHTVLKEANAANGNVADLNKDGYLDLVIGFFDKMDGSTTDLVIYYGSKDGLETKNRVAISSEGRSTSPTIGDYNKDGWLDIAVASYSKDLLRIFYGGPKGFDAGHQKTVDVPSIIDLETADLNNDGWLDIIACSYNDRVNKHHDTGLEILWGSADGFNSSNAQWLPSFTPLGPVAADFDNDGYLDLFCPAYLGDVTREDLPMNLYWGGPNGFDPGRKTVLFANSGADALAADFNKDGKMDLLIASHTSNGFHSKGMAKLYYNDGQRFTSQSMKVDDIPSPGCHWMWNVDMGHVYNRKFEQSYTSAVFNWKRNNSEGKIDYKADIPAGTKLVFAVRSADTKATLDTKAWQQVESDQFKVEKAHRFLQYKVNFISDNGDRYPVLDRVSVTLK